MTIKKGDRFRCISNVLHYYIKDKVYLSEVDECLTDEEYDINHGWLPELPSDRYRASECFEKIEETPKQKDWEVTSTGSDFEVKYHCPSGFRQFDTGAVRDSNEGKSRPDLISPYFTNRLGLRLAEGAKKYSENNWKKGIPSEAFLESLERHLVAYKMGKTDEDHAGAIAFNIMGIIHNEEISK